MTGGKFEINVGATVKEVVPDTANPKKRKPIPNHNVLGDLPTSKRLKPLESASTSNNRIETKMEAERSQIFGAYEDQASEEEEEVSTSVRDCKGRHFSATKEAELRESFQIIIKAEGPCPSYDFEMSGHPLANVASWQTYSAVSGGQKGKDFRKEQKHNDSLSSPHTRQPSGCSTPSSGYATRPRGYRETDQYIFFFGSVLSNFNKGAEFSCYSTLSYLLRQLDQLGTTHPSEDALATKLLATHFFICGEQWMMACKAWLFESPSIPLAANNVCKLGDSIENTRARLMHPAVGPMNSPQENTFRQSTLVRILRASDPKRMKDLGRQCPGWDEQLWNRASIPIVVAGTVARAEADHLLGKIYRTNKDGSKKFVEGSPYDRIWGVGIEYGDPKIEKPVNWRGGNRLGKCHDEACRIFNQREALRQASEGAEAPFEGFAHDKKESEQKPCKVEPDTATPRVITVKFPEVAKQDSNEVGELPESSGDQTSEEVKAPSTTEEDRNEKIEKDSKDKAEKMDKGKKEFIAKWQGFSGKRGGEKGKAFR